MPSSWLVWVRRISVPSVDRVKILELLTKVCAPEADGLDAFLKGLQEGDAP